jgi:hypothetical protein
MNVRIPPLAGSFAAVLLILAVVGETRADDSEYTRRSLRGIARLTVIVEGLGDLEGKGSLSQSMLQTDVELRLRQSGLTIDKDSRVLLYINLNAHRSSTFPIWAISASVAVHQPVRLDRDQTIWLPGAATWSTAEVATVGEARLTSVGDWVRDMVDRFLNAYFAENPMIGRTPRSG